MAFYERVGPDRFRSTEHTVGPWSPGNQHMGPPSALLARQLERTAPSQDSALARVTVEILGPVPKAELTARTWLERSGRSVHLQGAELLVGGRAVARAFAWWLSTNDTTEVAAGPAEPLPPVGSGQPWPTPDGWQCGYMDAMEMVTLKGGLGLPGPATMWMRQRMPLVAGEEPSGVQRLMNVADCGNGASNLLDPKEWFFINTELTVHAWQVPAGEWIGIDAHTTIGPTGVGVAATVLHDPDGPVAHGSQSLLVRRR